MKATFIWTTVFLGLALLRAATLSIAPSKDLVLVRTVADNRAVIVNSAGAAYLVEKDAGCRSLGGYQGQRVVLDAPDAFLSGGSRLVIPEVNQSCHIVNVREMAPADGQR
jgi:hypothetical protein